MLSPAKIHKIIANSFFLCIFVVKWMNNIFMDKWLSFIVPIYNVEDYLAECIDSLLHQSFSVEQYEIILYDDGSTDKSLQIAQKYEANYSNVRVFTHINSGAAKTRNEAIEKASGEYIWFVDSDDFIAPNLLPLFYEKTQVCKLDMLIFNNIAFEQGKCRRFIGFDVPESSVKSGMELYQEFYYNPVLTNRLICRDLLIKYHLRYIPGNKAEDCVLNPLCFYHARAVCSVPIDAYYYRMRSQSVSHNVDNQNIIIASLLEGLEYHCDYMKEHPAPEFWMKVFVHDIRRIHIWLDIASCKKGIGNGFINREKLTLKSVMRKLPYSWSVDYAILAVTSISPSLILNVQRYLRTIKRWIR